MGASRTSTRACATATTIWCFCGRAVNRRFAEGAFDPVEASQNLDQSRFAYLHNYDDLGFRSRNALAVAEEIFQTRPK